MLRVRRPASPVVLVRGGIHGFELARVVMFTDAIIAPVCHSVFDRESAAACRPPGADGPAPCGQRALPAATVNMRIDSRTSRRSSAQMVGRPSGCRFWAYCCGTLMCAA